MRNFIFILLILASPLASFGQSETIQKWHKKYDDAFVMFFYKSTLNMLNIQDSKEFEELIKDIDKMKLLRIDKEKFSFSKEQYKELVSDYRGEDFEELMTLKQKEMKINAYIKEDGGDTEGIVVLLNEASNLIILDIKGSVPLAKIAELAKYAENFSKSNISFD
jgi:hypothetical protein